MSCLIDTEFLTRWRVNYGITRMEPWHMLPQFQELASKTWKRMNLGTEDCTENKEDDKTTMTDLKMSIRADCAVSAWSPPPQPMNALTSRLSEGGVRQTSALPLSCHIWNKANFPLHQSGLFIAFCGHVARPHTFQQHSCFICPS